MEESLTRFNLECHISRAEHWFRNKRRFKCRYPRSPRKTIETKMFQRWRSINIIWVSFWGHSLNSPTGTFHSLHSFIFLMWLEHSSTTFMICTQNPNDSSESRRHWKKETIETFAELPPQGVKSELKWRDGLCWVGINVGWRLQSHVHDGISRSEKCV